MGESLSSVQVCLYLQGSDPPCTYVGQEAWEKNGPLSLVSLVYPVQRGIVNNWDQAETLWQHTFNTELSINPSERHLLMTEPPLNPDINKEKTLEVRVH